MFSRLSVVIGRDLNCRIRCGSIRIYRLQGNVSSTASDSDARKSVRTKQEDKTEQDSCDYLGVSETFEANVGEGETLVTETKEKISRTYGLGKYTAPDAYDGTLQKTNFGEIKIDCVRKGVIPPKKNFSKLKPELGSIADSLISYREKVDRRKYSLPVSDLLSQHLEGLGKESDGTVKENSQSSTLSEPIFDYYKPRNVHQNSTVFNESKMSDSVKPTDKVNEKQKKHNNESSPSTPRNIRKEQNSSLNATKGNRFFMKPEDLIMEVVNEDENKRQSKHSTNSSIKKGRDSSDAQQIHRSSNTKNIDWNVMLEDNLETKSSLKYQQKSDQTPQNIDDNMLDSIIKEEIEVEIQHIKDTCEQTHENGLTNKVMKDKSLENVILTMSGFLSPLMAMRGFVTPGLVKMELSARGKTILRDTEKMMMYENESRTKLTAKYDSNLLKKETNSSVRTLKLETVTPDRKKIDWNYLLEDNNSEMQNSWKCHEKNESSSPNLDRMLDSIQTKDRNFHEEGLENDFAKQVTPKDNHKSGTSKLGNAAYEYFHDEGKSLAEGENYNNEEEEDGFAEELKSDDDNDEKSGTAMIENAAYKYFSDLQEKSLAPKIDATSKVDLSKFVPKNVNQLTEEEVVDELVESILYNKDDILAINKIYGIPSQGGEGVRLNIADLLPKLAERIHCDKLHMVHRLDKETTGIMLFGKTEEMASKLRKAFKDRKVKKTYLVIAKGIPSLKEGIINVPIAEGEVGKDKRKRMTCIPVYNSDTKHVMHKTKKKTVPAVTHYKVVANSHSCALLEVSPETGVKHQIRTHLLHVLNTPVLGDHKYSYLTEIKPQILPSDVIRQLGIRQSKARNLPMYLHSKNLIIPEFLDGRTFSVHCSVPRAFRSFLKKAKISHRNVDERI